MKKPHKLLIVFIALALIISFSVYCTKTEKTETVVDKEVVEDEHLIAFE